MAHEDYKAMLPGQALSALDADEARALDQHLAECAECREELADWEKSAATLALIAEPAEPSPEVRRRIMDAVRSEKSAGKGAPADRDSRVLPFAPVRRNIWTSFGSLGSIAAIVLFPALIVGIVLLWQQNRAMKQELARTNEFVRLVTEPGARLAELSGTEQAAGATAKIAYSKNGRVLLLASNLPPAPQGKEYQLWFIVGKNPPVPSKSFAPDGAGRGTLRDQVSRQTLDSAVFAITLEPAGGVSAPTGEIYLRSGL
jgi:anti-sigma-K factor RskA